MIRLLPCLIALACIAAPAQGQIMSGPAAVIDANTLDMTGSRVRLVGLDAPERKQSCTRSGEDWACGEEAARTLAAIIAEQAITCVAQGSDATGRTLAACKVRNIDIGQELLRRGMAIVLGDAPPGYAEASGIAQSLQYGLWAGDFQKPSEWRAAHPSASRREVRQDREGTERPPGRARAVSERRYTNALGCAIKGNRSRRGEWIYHLPGQAYYEDTRPEELFCTEREAMAAGYRRAKG